MRFEVFKNGMVEVSGCFDNYSVAKLLEIKFGDVFLTDRGDVYFYEFIVNSDEIERVQKILNVFKKVDKIRSEKLKLWQATRRYIYRQGWVEK
jgi:hypothetical protein